MASKYETARAEAKSPLYTPKPVAAAKASTVIRDPDGAYRARGRLDAALDREAA